MAQESRPATVLLVARSFVVKDDRVLMIQRSAGDRRNPSHWEAPGGKLDSGQDLRDCLDRELSEETKIRVRHVDNIAHYESRVINDGGPYHGMTYAVLFCISHIVAGEVELSQEHDAYRWCKYKQMIALVLTPETRKAAVHLERRLRRTGVK